MKPQWRAYTECRKWKTREGPETYLRQLVAASKPCQRYKELISSSYEPKVGCKIRDQGRKGGSGFLSANRARVGAQTKDEGHRGNRSVRELKGSTSMTT